MIRFGVLFIATLALCGCATAPRVSMPARTLAPAPAPIANARARMVDGALSMLGQPYRFGGAAPGGFDCSGLVVFATNGAGIRLPRTAHEQFNSGVPIARGEIQAGDLVFMHLAHKKLHVGIAIDNDRFIHAPSTGGRVRIDPIAAAPYARGYLSARRVIDTP